MHIAELTYPGTWLDSEDRDWCFRTESILHGMASALADAAVALALFERETAIPRRKQSAAERQADLERLRVLEESLSQDLGLDLNDWDDREEVSVRARVELKRQKWTAGETPRDYQRRVVFLHARSFLFALDRLEKLMKVLSEDSQVSHDVPDARRKFLDALPMLTSVRDSVAHYEDRSRGLDRDREPLELKPMSGPIVEAPGGGVLLLESLDNNRFGTTMNNGEYGEVEVSAASLEVAQKAVQAILDSFKWKGAPSHSPM